MKRHNVWIAAHGPAHVAAHASGREYAPRRAAVRAALSVLLLALVLLSRPTDALAASNPSVVYSDNGLYVVAPCDNGFDAALATIGQFSVRPRLTAEMRAKLSNASTGGDFYALAARFQQQNNTLEGFGNAVYIGVLTYNTALYGAGNIMQATGVTSSDISNARRDFNTIQNGGSLGGGGGSGGDGTSYSMNIIMNATTTSSTLTSKSYNEDSGGTRYTLCSNNEGKTGYTLYPQNFNVSLSLVNANMSSFFETYANDSDYQLWALLFRTVSGSGSSAVGGFSFFVYAIPRSSVSLTTKTNPYYGNVVVTSPAANNVAFQRVKIVAGTNYTFDSGNVVITGGTVTVGSHALYNDTGSGSNWAWGTASAGSGGGNVSNNWPDDYLTGRPIETEPPVPTPPVTGPVTYPDPTDDPLPTPPPETPVTPVNPIVTTDPTNTTPQDYTPWLSAILNELRNFHRDAIGLGNNIVDSLATHCTHITTTIMDETEWLYDQLKAQIRAGVQAILNGLDQNCTEMMNYLEDLAQWLADQLQFTFNIDNSYNPEISVPAYDDGSVIAWLQRIYNAIRNIKGPTIGTPVTDKDVEDGFDWWAWILSLLDQLFDNVISQTVGEVESFLEEFRNLFPLSIPWDVVAILTMWAGTPTTPHFEFTLFEDVTYLPEVTYEIDLSDFDATAATIRDAEKIVFAFYLLFKTQWLLDTLKSATDAAGEFIEGVITS